MDLGDSLDVLMERKISCSCRDSNNISSSLVTTLRHPDFAFLPCIYDLFYVSRSLNETCDSHSAEYDISCFTIVPTPQLLQPD